MSVGKHAAHGLCPDLTRCQRDDPLSTGHYQSARNQWKRL